MEQGTEHTSVYEPAGLLWTWWRGDILPSFPSVDDFTVDALASDQELAQATNFGADTVRAQRQAGHCPYLARLGTHLVGYGWSATTAAVFGAPPVAFTIPATVRYLYDFVTLPPWRGRGVYPRLLQAIIAYEVADAEQFWILHQWANNASARGIAKAGFSIVGQICFLPTSGLGIIPINQPDRATLGAALLGLPLVPGTTR